MKDKIIMFVIGLLLGAVISTGSILAYKALSNNNDSDNHMMQMQKGAAPSGQNGTNPQEAPTTTTQSDD